MLDDGSVPGCLILLAEVLRGAVNWGWTFEELSNAVEIRMVSEFGRVYGMICWRLHLGNGLIGVGGLIVNNFRISFNSTPRIGEIGFLCYVSGGRNCSKQNAQEGNESG